MVVAILCAEPIAYLEKQCPNHHHTLAKEIEQGGLFDFPLSKMAHYSPKSQVVVEMCVHTHTHMHTL